MIEGGGGCGVGVVGRWSRGGVQYTTQTPSLPRTILTFPTIAKGSQRDLETSQACLSLDLKGLVD